jgi:hypothetical protein
MNVETMSMSFLVEPQNQGRRFGLKTTGMVSPGLASKPVVGFLVEPHKPGGGGFPGLGLKTGSYGLVIWALKSL